MLRRCEVCLIEDNYFRKLHFTNVTRHLFSTSILLRSINEHQQHIRILQQHCRDVGRDAATIEMTVSFPIVIRDDPRAAEAVLTEMIAGNGVTDPMEVPVLLGPPSLVADGIRPYRELGFETVIARMPSPFDRETIDRLGEVRALLAAGGG